MEEFQNKLNQISRTSEQGEELTLKMAALCNLVKNGIIKEGSAISHFKQWVKDRNRQHARLKDAQKRIDESERYMSGHRVDHRMRERVRDYSKRVNPDIYGAINSDNFRG